MTIAVRIKAVLCPGPAWNSYRTNSISILSTQRKCRVIARVNTTLWWRRSWKIWSVSALQWRLESRGQHWGLRRLQMWEPPLRVKSRKLILWLEPQSTTITSTFGSRNRESRRMSCARQALAESRAPRWWTSSAPWPSFFSRRQLQTNAPRQCLPAFCEPFWRPVPCPHSKPCSWWAAQSG